MPVPQAKRIGGSAAHPTLREFPANEPLQRLAQSYYKKKQTDRMTAETTPGELDSGYRVLIGADLITRPMSDETTIPTDGLNIICTSGFAYSWPTISEPLGTETE